MPDVVKAHLLIEPHLPAFKTIVVLLPIDDVLFLLAGVYDLPEAELLSRCLVLCLLKEYFRCYRVCHRSIFLHLHVVFDPAQGEV